MGEKHLRRGKGWHPRRINGSPAAEEVAGHGEKGV